MEPDPILRVLREELEGAQRRRDAASERFDEMIRQVPSGIPYPDSTFRIKQASREYTRTLQELQGALLRINDYLTHGKIPPELAGLGSKPAAKEAYDPTRKKSGTDSN